MKTYIINMEKDIERRKHIIEQCNQFNIDYTIVSAVDGRKIPDDSLKNMVHPVYGKGLTKGEIGCALSHYYIYKKMVDDYVNHALVLEDDAELGEMLPETLDIMQKKFPSYPAIILLNKENKYTEYGMTYISPKLSMVNVISATLSHGYLINRQAALKLVDFLYPIWIEADRWIFYKEYNIVKIKALIPPCISLSELSANSVIWPHESDLQERKKIEYQRSLVLEKIKKDRSIFIKIKLFFWRNFTRKIIGVKNNDF